MDASAPAVAPPPVVTNASGDFIRNLKFPQSGTSNPAVRQSGDRLEAFYHRLKGAEGTLRTWTTRAQADKMTFIANLIRPDKGKMNPAEFNEAFDFWRTAMLGCLDAELMQDTPDLLVAQAALDSFRLPKYGKR